MTGYGYGVWLLVVVNSAIFIIFAASFFHPRSKRDWKAMGAGSEGWLAPSSPHVSILALLGKRTAVDPASPGPPEIPAIGHTKGDFEISMP